MQEITGTHASDNVSEVTLLQSLSTQVIAVGIAVNGTTLDRLDIIDSNGTALDVNDPNDLDAILQGTNPITGQADGNVITGVNGGPGAIDLLSQDDDTTVTQIAFNGTTVNVHPVNGATINGEDGVLKIFANGSYTYTLSNGAIATNGAYHDQFVYTITDGDGDTSQATLTLNSELPEITVDVNVNNGVDSICVKEDGQGSVPVTASYNGGNGDEVMTLTLTGVQPTWVITAPGWVNQGGGTYTLTLPAGQTN